MPLRLAVLGSGGGTTLQNLLDRVGEGSLGAAVELVVSSDPGAYILERARLAGIESAVVAPRPADSAGDAVFRLCRERNIELVVLAGYMHLLPIAADFERRVMNIHPSLIPAFSGKGCYGSRVHAAAIERGVKVSGCTVHFADDRYDHGPIILQKCVPVLEDDVPDVLAARVFRAECEAYPEAIRLFAAGKLKVVEGRVRIG